MKSLKAFFLTCTLMLAACGGEPQIIYVYQTPPPDQQQSAMQQQYPSTMQQQQYPSAMQQNPNVAGNQIQSPGINNISPLQKPGTGTTLASKTAMPNSAVLKTQTPANAAGSAASSTEDKLLKKARDSFQALNTFQASVTTFEDSGTQGTGQIKLLYRKPSSIKVDVISSSASGQAGVKLSYSDPNTVSVRPSGMLSMVSVSLAMTDPKLLSGRKYQLNQIDLQGTVMRLTQPGTKAKLVGQSQVNGSQVYMLEITNNHFDPQVTREVLGLDAKTFMPRMHEMYVGDKKVYAVQINTVTLNPSLTDADFQV